MKEFKENKNVVFSLKCFTKNLDSSLSHDGFLLFPDKARSVEFMKISQSIQNLNKISNHYEEHGYVNVGDYVSSRVKEQNHFFVKNVEKIVNDETEPLFLDEISGVQNISSINSAPTYNSNSNNNTNDSDASNNPKSSAYSDSLVDSVKEMERLEEIENNFANEKVNEKVNSNPGLKP